MPPRAARLAALAVAVVFAACNGAAAPPTTSVPSSAAATLAPAPTVPPTTTAPTTTAATLPPPTAAPTTLPATTTTMLPPPPPVVRLLLVGDIMLGRGVARSVAADPVAVFAGVRPLANAADLTAGNLESPLTTRPHIAINQNALEAHPDSAETLALGGFDVVSVANNHATDAGRVSVVDTMEAVAAAGLLTVGGGLNREAAFTPLIVERGGVTVGFLAFDVTLAGWPAQPNRPGVAHWDPALAEPAVRALREMAEVVVVSIHGGVEYRTATDRRMAVLADDLAAWGADVVWGHGPHVVQPVYDITTAGGRPVVVATSLGNFLFDMRDAGTQRGALLEVEADASGVIAYRVGSSEHPDRVVEFTGWEEWVRLRG